MMKLLSKFLFLALLISPMLLMAQPDPPGGGGAPVPIDGGISILVAAGAAIGAKKVRDNRRMKNKENIES